MQNSAGPVQSSEIDTRASCDSLKGLAILAVLINHYMNDFSTINVGGFANTIVSVFFLLSGYGIFVSVTKKVVNDFSLKSLGLFYRDRLVRLFPLYWIALALQMWVNHEPYQVSDFFGIGAEEHYWFISAILQCYFLSPILAYALDRRKYLAFFSVTSLVLGAFILAANYPFLNGYLDFFHLVESPYLNIYFLHTYLFFLGMSLQKFGFLKQRTHLENRLSNYYHCFVFALLFCVVCSSIILDKAYSFPVLGILVFVTFWVAYSLRNGIEMRFLSFFGKISFSIYLFHMTYYYALARLGLLRIDSLFSVALMLLVSPLFIFICIRLEQFGSDVARRLKRVAV